MVSRLSQLASPCQPGSYANMHQALCPVKGVLGGHNRQKLRCGRVANRKRASPRECGPVPIIALEMGDSGHLGGCAFMYLDGLDGIEFLPPLSNWNLYCCCCSSFSLHLNLTADELEYIPFGLAATCQPETPYEGYMNSALAGEQQPSAQPAMDLTTRWPAASIHPFCKILGDLFEELGRVGAGECDFLQKIVWQSHLQVPVAIGIQLWSVCVLDILVILTPISCIQAQFEMECYA